MKKIKIFQFTFLSFIIVLASCNEKVVKNYQVTGAILRAEGPLYDGPNTLQVIHQLNLQSIDPKITTENIESVKLIKATVQTADSVGFNRVRNFVFQITSRDAKMQKVAALNPVPKGRNEVELSQAAEADLSDNFGQSDIILILDADIEGDWEENFEYTGSFDFEITYKR